MKTKENPRIRRNRIIHTPENNTKKAENIWFRFSFGFAFLLCNGYLFVYVHTSNETKISSKQEKEVT